MSAQVAQPALHQDAHVVADHRIHAGGRVAGQNHAGQQKRDQVLPLQQRVPDLLIELLARALLNGVHLLHFKSCIFVAARAQQRLLRLVFGTAAEQPAWRLGHQQAAQHKQNSRRQRHPEDRAPGMVLEVKQRGGIAQSLHRRHLVAEVHAHQRRRHNAEGQQPLEHSGSFSPVGSGKALGKVKRNHHADQPAADSLQQTAAEQSPISSRERNHRDAEDERNAAENHQRLAAHPVGKHPSEQRGEDAAQQHSRHNFRELGRGQIRRGIQVGKRSANNAYVDAVQQASQPSHQQQKGVISANGCVAGVPRQIHQTVSVHSERLSLVHRTSQPREPAAGAVDSVFSQGSRVCC